MEYYGPYNTLLHDLFPHEEHFQVVPQFKGLVYHESIDFTTMYIVRTRKPVVGPGWEAKVKELVASIKAMCADIACACAIRTPHFF